MAFGLAHTSGSQISPPVWSRPRIVKMKLSSPPTLLNPRKTQVGIEMTSPGWPISPAVDRSRPQRNT